MSLGKVYDNYYLVNMQCIITSKYLILSFVCVFLKFPKTILQLSNSQTKYFINTCGLEYNYCVITIQLTIIVYLLHKRINS